MTTSPSESEWHSPVQDFPMPDTIEECKAMIVRLGEDRASIDFQLSRSISQERQDGIKPNWDWIRRARSAHKIKGLQIMRLNNHIAELNAATAQQVDRPTDVAEAFMAVAIRMLDPEARGDIWDAVFVNYPELKGKINPV